MFLLYKLKELMHQKDYNHIFQIFSSAIYNKYNKYFNLIYISLHIIITGKEVAKWLTNALVAISGNPTIII